MIHLTKVNPMCCTELCSYKGSDRNCKLALHIMPASDLVLRKPLTVLFTIPSDYSTKGGLQVFHSYPRLFRLSDGNNSTNETNEVTIPWLNNCKHDVSVWFYTLRSLFKKNDEKPWDTPALLIDQFPSLKKTPLGLDSADRHRTYHQLVCGVGRTRGRRSYMEDVDFQYSDIDVNEKCRVSVYGVLDGHGGSDCAQFVADELPTKLTIELRAKRPAAEALFSSFLKTDDEFMNVASDSQAGCTATVCVWDGYNNIGYIANAGDTRAVLCRDGKALDLTVDKKATDPSEISRIIREGGFVSNGRVMGSLAVSRALGDASLKHTQKRILIPDPEVTSFCYQPEKGDEFMILATDGLWDVVSSQVAVEMVKEQFEKHDTSPDCLNSGKEMSAFIEELNGICNHLANHACKQLHSSDNITVMVLIFHKWLDSNVVVHRANVEECPKEEYVGIYGIQEEVAKYGRDIKHWESLVNLDSISSWDEIIFQHIQEPYRDLFLNPSNAISSGVHNQRNESEYLSASIYNTNTDQYNQGLQSLVVDKLKLPTGKVFHSQSRSSDESSASFNRGKLSDKCINLAKSRPSSGNSMNLNLVSTNAAGLQSPGALARELDSLMMSPIAPSASNNNKKSIPTSFHPLPRQTPLANSTVTALSYAAPVTEDPLDTDMDFLLDDRNF